MSTSHSPPKHFFLLDLLRGFAALVVVLWHWQHFYYFKNGIDPNFKITQQPCYSVFYVFYNYGFVAVDLFFLISGFIFFFLYADKISGKKITTKSFALLRFSRLYPLHLVTLILVCFLQYFFYAGTGSYFVYTENNYYHFFLNLFFAVSWGLEKGPSFNGPGWSVSVEILLYLLFFIICRFKLNRVFVLAAIMVAALVVQGFYQPLGRGLYSFFLGGLVYYLYLYLIKSGRAMAVLKFLGIINLIFIVAIAIEAKYEFLQYYCQKFLHANFHYNIIVHGLIFPFFVLYLILLETIKGAKGKKLAFIGNISYSSYLLHFPLQLIIVFFCNKWHINRFHVFNSGYALLCFFTLLITLSLLSFYFFELPMQTFLRKTLLKKNKEQVVALQ